MWSSSNITRQGLGISMGTNHTDTLPTASRVGFGHRPWAQICAYTLPMWVGYPCPWVKLPSLHQAEFWNRYKEDLMIFSTWPVFACWPTAFATSVNLLARRLRAFLCFIFFDKENFIQSLYGVDTRPLHSMMHTTSTSDKSKNII
jgi:hypothetical protein